MTYLKNDGTVIYTPHQTFQSHCNLDFSSYPYDTQTCKLHFGTWTYNTKEVDIKLVDIKGFTELFLSETSAWEVSASS